jgi:hypothetical protein
MINTVGFEQNLKELECAWREEKEKEKNERNELKIAFQLFIVNL